MKRLIVAISGATGVQMGARLLEVLHYMLQVETHLVISRGAEVIFQRETSIDLEELKKLADYTYDVDNLAAAISSGSYRVPSPRERGSQRTSAPSAAPDTRMCMPLRRWQSSYAWPPTRRCASVPGCIWTTPARRKLKR